MFRSYPVILWVTLLLYITLLTVTEATRQRSPTPTAKTNNHELLTRVGLTRVRAPNSHHRKRLAVESRHHSRSDDSHMFVIKLPPNQHYYAHSKPFPAGSLMGGGGVAPSPNKLPVDFKGNGKLGKIYHWNIPYMKQIAKVKSKARRNNDVLEDMAADQGHRDSGVFDVKYMNGEWNDVLDKPSVGGGHKKPSYYAPSKPKKASFMKYFPGNGKPKSFYVIEKSKKKTHHHRLLQ